MQFAPVVLMGTVLKTCFCASISPINVFLRKNCNEYNHNELDVKLMKYIYLKNDAEL